MTDDERWKDAPGHEDKYKVSDNGRVMRKEYSIEQPKPGNNDGTYTRTFEPKLMAQHDCNGYRTVNLSVGDNGHETAYVHRLVLKAFAGDPPSDDHEANHINGNKADNRVENLEWATRQENVDHAHENGLANSGWKDVKVPGSDIPVLRQRYEDDDELTYRELAEEYGVTTIYMMRLLTGNTKRTAVA